MKPPLLTAICCIVGTLAHLSQDSVSVTSTCWQAAPLDQCDVVILTEYGLYYMPVPRDKKDFRLAMNWGVLFNTDRRNAFGISFFAYGDREFNAGPEFRYRRWLNETQSIDIGIGFPLFGESSIADGSFSPHGLVKWNPVHWMGITVRPELRRKGDPIGGPVIAYPPIPEEPRPYRFHLSAGLEFGWIPGLTLSAATGVLIGYLALAWSGK